MQKIAKLTDKEQTDSQNKAPPCQHDRLSNLDFLTESTSTRQWHPNATTMDLILTNQPGIQSQCGSCRQVTILSRTQDAPIQRSPPLKSVTNEVIQVSLATQLCKYQLDWLSALVRCEVTLICLWKQPEVAWESAGGKLNTDINTD